MSFLQAKEITNLYLYGQKNTPNNKASDIFIRPKEPAHPVFNVSDLLPIN